MRARGLRSDSDSSSISDSSSDSDRNSSRDSRDKRPYTLNMSKTVNVKNNIFVLALSKPIITEEKKEFTKIKYSN